MSSTPSSSSLRAARASRRGVGVAALPETKTRIPDRIRVAASSAEVSFLR
jgi:hypothetical protein